MVHRRTQNIVLRVHSYDGGALYTIFVYVDGTPENAEHCSAMYIPITAERCTGFFVYIDGTPQNAEHCSAKYIPMTAERCTRSAKYIPMTAERCTSSAKYILMTEERCTRTAKYILMTAERSTLFCEPLMVFTGTHEPCSVVNAEPWSQ